MNSNQLIGAQGEEIIAHYLEESGNEIIDRNWRTVFGEIDIVALSPHGVVIFVEVKTRSSLRFGEPLEAIHPQKARRLQKLARAWMQAHASVGAQLRAPHEIAGIRIDCAGVLLIKGERPRIDYRAGVL